MRRTGIWWWGWFLLHIVLGVRAAAAREPGASQPLPRGTRVVHAGLLRVPVVSGAPDQAAAETWRVAGIWVATPRPGTRPAEDTGRLGREVVGRLLAADRLEVRRHRRPEGRDRVAQLVVRPPRDLDGRPGAGAREDLGVFLARHGLALCDRTTALDPVQADAICRAERQARRWRLGMHGLALGEPGVKAAAVEILGLPQPAEGSPDSADQEAISEEDSEPGTWWTRTDHLEYLPPID